jgi:hypothetical protein
VVSASVRGTIFEFDTFNLLVDEGTVEFSGASGASVLVDSGGSSFLDEDTRRPASPAETAAAELRPYLPMGAEAVINVTGALPEKESSPEFSVTITF